MKIATMNAVKTNSGVLWNATVLPALCLDIDGTIRHSKSAQFIKDKHDIALYPDVEGKLWEYRDNSYLIFGLSNQGGVAFGYKSWQDAEAELEATIALFTRNPFHSVQQCFHHEQGTQFPYNIRSLARKPDIGMLAFLEHEAFDEGFVVDWDKSLFVGDRLEDKECAKRAGMAFQWAWEFFGREKP